MMHEWYFAIIRKFLVFLDMIIPTFSVIPNLSSNIVIPYIINQTVYSISGLWVFKYYCMPLKGLPTMVITNQTESIVIFNVFWLKAPYTFLFIMDNISTGAQSFRFRFLCRFLLLFLLLCNMLVCPFFSFLCLLKFFF